MVGTRELLELPVPPNSFIFMGKSLKEKLVKTLKKNPLDGLDSEKIHFAWL